MPDAGRERAADRELRGAGVGVAAGDDADDPAAVLVALPVRLGHQRRRRRRHRAAVVVGGRQRRGRCRRTSTRPACSAPGSTSKPGLECTERHRHVGADRLARDLAGRGVDPARYVDRDDHGAAPSSQQRREPCHRLAQRAVAPMPTMPSITRSARVEQRRVARRRRRRSRRPPAPRSAASAGSCAESRQQQRVDARASCGQPRAGVHRVAAVAARTDEQHDPRAVDARRAARRNGEPARTPRAASTCRRAATSSSGCFGGAHRRRVVRRPHRVDLPRCTIGDRRARRRGTATRASGRSLVSAAAAATVPVTSR